MAVKAGNSDSIEGRYYCKFTVYLFVGKIVSKFKGIKFINKNYYPNYVNKTK